MRRRRSAELRSTDALVRRMRELDRNQAQIARKAGCTRQFISNLATGKSSTCSVEIAHAIEEELCVTAGSLFVIRNSPVATDLLSRENVPA